MHLLQRTRVLLFVALSPSLRRRSTLWQRFAPTCLLLISQLASVYVGRWRFLADCCCSRRLWLALLLIRTPVCFCRTAFQSHAPILSDRARLCGRSCLNFDSTRPAMPSETTHSRRTWRAALRSAMSFVAAASLRTVCRLRRRRRDWRAEHAHAPLVNVYDPSAFEAALANLGEDALVLSLFRQMSLRDKRALACTSRAANKLVSREWSTGQLNVSPADAEWANAIFVARLRDLKTLRVGDDEFDLAEMRTQSPIDVVDFGTASALFLGAWLSHDVHRLILADGRTVDADSLRTCRRLDLDTLFPGCPAPISDADIAFLQGLVWRNPRLKLGASVALLRTRAFANQTEYQYTGWRMQAASAREAEQMYMRWARSWTFAYTTRQSTLAA